VFFSCQFATGHFQFQFHLCNAADISGPEVSHLLRAVSKVFANLVKWVISLPEKPECFQSFLLDCCLVCSKHLINSLHVILPADLPVSVAFVSCYFLVLLLLAVLRRVAMPDASSVTANIGSALDLDLHEKPLHRIGSIWCPNHVVSNLYGFYLFNVFFFFRSESILCPFKITAVDITWHYVSKLGSSWCM
jgi:hypothetical protein